MVKNDVSTGKAQKKAKKVILERYAKTAGKTRNGKKSRSWRQLGRQMGFAPAYLRQVALGHRKASIKLLQALNIKPDAVIVIAAPCHKCGQVHVSKRCTHHNTFEDNAKAYDQWLSDPKTQKKLADMMAWAETPKEKRQSWVK